MASTVAATPRDLIADEECTWRAVAVLTQAGADVLRAAVPPYVTAISGHLLDLLTAKEAAQLGRISDSVSTRAMHGGESPSGATHG